MITVGTDMSIPMDDRGLAYGDGLFETILVHGKVPTLWDYHLSRLRRGCDVLGFSSPSLASLETAFSFPSTENSLNVTKLIITRGSGGRGYAPPVTPQPCLLYRSSPFSPRQDRWLPVNRIRICQLRLGHQPVLAGIKHLNRLENVLARQEIDRVNASLCVAEPGERSMAIDAVGREAGAGYAEGILVDSEGLLIEATAMNLCWREEAQWFTPDLSLCGVAGTLRAALIEAGKLKISRLSLTNLARADALLLLNSVQGVWPVHTIDDAQGMPIWTARALDAHAELQQHAHTLLGYDI